MGPKALTKPQNYTQTLNSRYAMFGGNCFLINLKWHSKKFNPLTYLFTFLDKADKHKF